MPLQFSKHTTFAPAASTAPTTFLKTPPIGHPVTADAQGAMRSWAVAEPGAHTLTLTYSGSGEILVRNCAHADGVMRPYSAAMFKLLGGWP